jgi:catechol 2,3-dioxygenase-like lactoylglutathione lyase family enzyme
VTTQLELVALDAADIESLSAFYTALTGAKVVGHRPDWITILLPSGQAIAFQLAPDHVAPNWPGQDRPQQVHLDLQVNGTEAVAARAIELGATRLADGANWITLADPAGHPFDLCQRDDLGPEVVELFAVTIDAADPSGLAKFYADLLGAEVGYDGPEGALVAGPTSVMIQRIESYNPPVWLDPARPQQAHLDILVDDLDTGEARALALGATRLDGGGETFRVFADPAGHPFCLTWEHP